MKKLLLLIILICSFHFVNAQYTSPGTFKKLNMDSLVALSGGAVVDSGTYYRIQANVKISANDTLEILTSKTIKLDTTVLLNVRGVLIIDPVDSVLFTCMYPFKNYMGITLDTSNASVFRNAIFEYGGGIRLSSSSILIEYCKIRNNKRLNPNANNATNVINLFRSSPVVRNCVIENNAGAAIGGGANIPNAPKLYNNYIYGNNTNNDNRPQINIGTTGTDTLIIKGNKIIGNRTKILVGGIAASSIIGSVFAVIDSNEIDDNRYGITLQGGNSRSVISNNKIRNNNTQNIAAQGGSGLNFIGTNTQIAMVSNNYIAGNLWGATIQTSATPNFGEAGVNPGGNVFENNGNGGQSYSLFNNTAQNIKAENNQWNNSVWFAGVEGTISHKADDPALGTVDYRPFIGQQITDYVSPLDSVHLTLDDIVADTSGAVEDHGAFYQLRANVKISRTDTLDIVGDKTIKIDSGLLVNVLGAIRITGDTKLLITATDTTKNYKGFIIDSSDVSSIRNAIVEFGGGIKLLNSDIQISASEIRKNSRGNANNAVDLTNSSPMITTSVFKDNKGSAIGASGFNIPNAPKIIDNMFINNNTHNDDRAQIHLSSSGNDTAIISQNHIEGGNHINVGGIAVMGTNANTVIEHNTITTNAYGILFTGATNRSLILSNIIENNNIQGNPNIDGYGINFTGDTTLVSTVTDNYIAGNLRGISVFAFARPNLGETGVNPGGNEFLYNGSGTDTVAVYNFSHENIKAENNKWLNFTTLSQVERVVYHLNDNNTVGLVDFDPFVGQIVTGVSYTKASAVKVYPQPADQLLMIDADVKIAEIMDMQGRLMKKVEGMNQIDVADLPNGIYLLQVNGGQRSKLVISR